MASLCEAMNCLQVVVEKSICSARAAPTVRREPRQRAANIFIRTFLSGSRDWKTRRGTTGTRSLAKVSALRKRPFLGKVCLRQHKPAPAPLPAAACRNDGRPKENGPGKARTGWLQLRRRRQGCG